MSLEPPSQATSGLLKLIHPDAMLTPIESAPTKCRDCGADFKPRESVTESGRWAEICVPCSRKRYHQIEGFPIRYRNLKLSDCREFDGNRAALSAAREWVESNGDGNLWFYGSPGTGKTHIACASAAEGPLGKAVFISAPEMFLAFQASVKEHSELDYLNDLSSCGKYSRATTVHLFDDIGAHRVSDFALEMFGLLLDRFYGNNTTGLIFTSNLSPKQMLDTMGERISSRLQGLAKPIKIDGQDWRLGDR